MDWDKLSNAHDTDEAVELYGLNVSIDLSELLVSATYTRHFDPHVAGLYPPQKVSRA
jgi:hypothetical protein